MTRFAPESPEFSGWRAFLWPVHHYELKKLLPMLGIFFLISFDYNILRTMKDTLVVTAQSSGAEVIPFIKVWVMLPGAILMTFLFTRLSNRLARETVIYVLITLFLVYFALFAFVLYPARDTLHPHAVAERFEAIFPVGLKGLIATFRNWTLTSFYVMSELWSNIILSLLFWGYANQVTRVNEAKRFYGLLGIGANLSGIAAGQAAIWLNQSTFNPAIPFGSDAWEQSMTLLILMVIGVGVAALVLFRWMNVKVLADPRYYDPSEATREKSVIGKISIRDSFLFLFRSRYLLCIAAIVLSYNLVINLTEVLWKGQIKELYPNPADFNLYMNQVMTWIGVLATFTALFVSGNSIRRCGWTFTAMLTPAILFTTSIGFFAFFFMKDIPVEGFIQTLGTTPLALVVLFGSTQNILCRAAKYSVFDATKEMSFVPLDSEYKLKGKAAIDGVCSRLGKSGGSLIHQGLLLFFSTLTNSAPYAAGFLFMTISLWIVAVQILGKKFTELTTVSKPPVVQETSDPILQEKQAV